MTEKIFISLRDHRAGKWSASKITRMSVFVVYHQPPPTAGGMPEWQSIICNGVIELLTDPESIKKAVRSGEKHMGMPEGTELSLSPQ